MAYSQALKIAEDDSEEIEGLLLFWQPGCHNDFDKLKLHEDECPNCFGGNVATVFDQSGAHLKCVSCGVTGAAFEPHTGR